MDCRVWALRALPGNDAVGGVITLCKERFAEGGKETQSAVGLYPNDLMKSCTRTGAP